MGDAFGLAARLKAPIFAASLNSVGHSDLMGGGEIEGQTREFPLCYLGPDERTSG